jgi:GntR family transcriptional regulator, rspAB operon transcriptional repressor
VTEPRAKRDARARVARRRPPRAVLADAAADQAPGGAVRRRRPTARDLVAGELRRRIVRGDLPAGERLSPNAVAEQHGVSPTPAREAIQLLASEGLVRIDAYRGAHVAELTVDEYEELYLVRVGIEALAARLGAERAGDDDVARMAAQLAEMERAAADGDVDRFADHDRRFHRAHYQASGRPSLVERIMRLRVSSERYARAAYAMPNVSMADTIATHRTLLETVRAHDGDACEATIRADLRRTLDTFAEQWHADPLPSPHDER